MVCILGAFKTKVKFIIKKERIDNFYFTFVLQSLYLFFCIIPYIKIKKL